MSRAEEKFGCAQCFPDDAEVAAVRWYKLPTVEELIDESHFSIRIRQCAACQQKFITIFAETIDWIGGEDPQECCVMPVAEDEVWALTECENDRALHIYLGRLAPERRCLHTLWPSAKAKVTRWSRGVIIGMHD